MDADTSMSGWDTRLLRTAMSLAFYGFLRVGEFTATPLHREVQCLVHGASAEGPLEALQV